jgi:hypothetical protein
VAEISGCDHIDPLDLRRDPEIFKIEILCGCPGKFGVNMKVGGDFHFVGAGKIGKK